MDNIPSISNLQPTPPPQGQDGFLQTNAGNFQGGANTSMEPFSLPPDQYYWGVNVDNRKGIITTREGFDQQLTLPNGKVQMLAHFRNSCNLDFVVAAVGGRLYASPHPFTGFYDLGVQMSSTVNLMTHAVVERGAQRMASGSRRIVRPKRYLIVQDGVNPAFYWDGGCDYGQSQPNAPLAAPSSDIYVSTETETAPVSIPTGTWMASAGNRLWVARGEEIFWSDIADPLSFYDVGFLTGGQFRLRGDVTGLSPSPDGQSLLAFEKSQTWRFAINLPIDKESDWKKTPGFQSVLFPGIGCLAGNSFIIHYGDLWWWSNKDLMSMRRAGAARVGDELDAADLEMTKSREKFGTVRDNVVGISTMNYLLVNTPNNEIWVKDNTPVSLLNHTTPPAWVGVWTGLKVKEFCTFYSYADGNLYTFGLSQDIADNRPRIWRLFNKKSEDNSRFEGQSTSITCAFVGQAHAMGNIAKLKRIRWWDILLDNVWGNVSLSGYFKGIRGGWKSILEKNLSAARDVDANGTPLGQYRKLKTTELSLEDAQCNNCGQESDLMDGVDTAFQLLLKWTGKLSLTAYRITTFNEPELYRGDCEMNETETVHKVSCSDPLDFSYRPNPVDQPTYNGTNTQADCNGTPHTVNFLSTVSANDANVQAKTVVDSIVCLCCNDEVNRTYTSTQTAYGVCPDGSTGASTSATATATSTISMQDAVNQAQAEAQAAANAQLSCVFTATATGTKTCPEGTVGQPVTVTVTGTSSVSLVDAQNQADLALIQALANAGQCLPNQPLVVAGGYTNTISSQNTAAINLDSSISDGWAGSAGASGPTYGIVGRYNDYGLAGTNLVGNFSSYNNYQVFNLIPIAKTGSVNTSSPLWGHGTYAWSNGDPTTGTKVRSGYIQAVSQVQATFRSGFYNDVTTYDRNGGFIGGSFQDWDGQGSILAKGVQAYLTAANAYNTLRGEANYNAALTALNNIQPWVDPSSGGTRLDPPPNNPGRLPSAYGNYHMRRLTTNNSIWTKFMGIDGTPWAIFYGNSGYLYVGGNFQTYGISGDLDLYNATSNYTRASATDGYTTGTFPTTTVTTIKRPYLMRLNTDGSLASSEGFGGGFPPDTDSAQYGPNDTVYALGGDSLGLYVGGIFTKYAGVTVPKICRVDYNSGSLDTSFDCTNNGNVYSIFAYGGKVYVGTDSTITRYNQDGSPDSTFATVYIDGYPTSMFLKVVSTGSGNSITCLYASGTFNNASSTAPSGTQQGGFPVTTGDVAYSGGVLINMDGTINTSYVPGFSNKPLWGQPAGLLNNF